MELEFYIENSSERLSQETEKSYIQLKMWKTSKMERGKAKEPPVGGKNFSP